MMKRLLGTAITILSMATIALAQDNVPILSAAAFIGTHNQARAGRKLWCSIRASRGPEDAELIRRFLAVATE